MSKEKLIREDDPIFFDEQDTAIKEQLLEWIRQRFEPATEIHPRTSYGLKHEFKKDTGTYVFNGVMKGALIHLGFMPVNTSKQNWNFWMKRKLPGGFYKWGIENFKECDSPLGDFVKDMKDDLRFPKAEMSKVELLRYLNSVHACKDALKAFEELWKIYTHSQKDNSNK